MIAPFMVDNVSYLYSSYMSPPLLVKYPVLFCIDFTRFLDSWSTILYNIEVKERYNDETSVFTR